MIAHLLLSLLAAASPAHGSSGAADCLNKGKRLELLARDGGSKSQKQYEQSLEAFRCAARGGSAEGALLAAQLSQSGMAPALPEDTLRLLYRQAAQGGLAEGYLGLADLSCGPESSIRCLGNPHEALHWLFEAKRKHADQPAIYRIAEILLNGDVGVPDSSRAFSCFREAGGQGSTHRMLSLLQASPKLDTTLSCELSP